MEEKTELFGGYAICLNQWALDKDIKNELGLLLIISSLCAKEGYCWATNDYLSEIYNEAPQTISAKIKKLESKGYISIEYKKRGCEVIDRKIRLIKCLIDDKADDLSTINQTIKDNNINNNIININNNKKDISKDISKKERFKKPTIEEIQQYCNERNNDIDAEQFYDFYESKGWLVGNNKMKDWKACVRTWEKRKNTKKSYREVISDNNKDFFERKRKEIEEEQNE